MSILPKWQPHAGLYTDAGCMKILKIYFPPVRLHLVHNPRKSYSLVRKSMRDTVRTIEREK